MIRKIENSVPYLKRRLRELASAKARRSQQRFFKEPVHSLGVRVPQLRQLAAAAAREYRALGLELDEILGIADRLWRGSHLEERVLAVLLLSNFGRQLEPGHWKQLDAWVDGLTNWGETDGLCCELLAPLLAKEPHLVKNLRAWTGSSSRWRRRAAAVSLVKAARSGQQHDAAFEICDRLAADRDDMVEKAVGWLLKEISRTDARRVADYLLADVGRFSRTTVRYACGKLPAALRRKVMEAK